MFKTKSLARDDPKSHDFIYLFIYPSQSWDIENLTNSCLNPKPKKKGGKKNSQFYTRKKP